LPEAVRVYQREYDLRSARMPEEMADVIEDKPLKVKLTPDVVSLAFWSKCCRRVHPRVTAIFRSPRRLIRYFVPRNRPYSRTQGLSGQRDRDGISIGQNRPMNRQIRTCRALAEHGTCALLLKRSLDEPLLEG
jgi:hypothetical protein